GKWTETDWIKNNHSVQEGGDVSLVHSSSNPKHDKKAKSEGKSSESKTGWNWYNIDFDEKQTMDTLKALSEFLYKNPPESKRECSKDINILAKSEGLSQSSPPNINTKYLYPAIDNFLL